MDEGRVTVLLHALNNGDASVAEELLPLVYAELHRLAAGYMRRERPDHTLQPTALINQAYLRIAKTEHVKWENRQHFIGFAATVMRRVLVDHARERHAAIRGGKQVRVELNEAIAFSSNPGTDILRLEDALSRLEKLSPRQAKVVEMRFFGGLSVDEIASVLGIAPRSVARDWTLARMWLEETISQGSSKSSETAKK
jgi:RNA polymerase sigma-70 factor, ECF subfamily